MNLDLLIKLVKLANNNPNDNEANLAARKVCKMIAEANYKFVDDVKVDSKINFNPNQRQKDYVRKEPPKRRTTVWDESSEFNLKDIEDILRNIYGSWPPKQPPSPKEKQKAEETNKTRSKNRVCTKCGQGFDTYNMREPFVCFACEFIQHNVRT